MATAFPLCVALLAGCQKEAPLTTPRQAQAYVDSVVTAQSGLLRLQADTDLDRRRSIEVKPLTDSFLRQKKGPGQ